MVAKQTPLKNRLFEDRLVQVGSSYPSSTHVIASYINGFTSYLTLFSKYFSTFVHTTCSLSILEEYLALRDVYLALWTARSSNPTLWPLDNRWTHPWEEGYLTGLSPSLVWPSSQLINLRWLHWPSVQNTTIRPCYPGSLSIPIVGLVPLFVRHYWGDHLCFLFSLGNNMLKFPRSFYIIWGIQKQSLYLKPFGGKRIFHLFNFNPNPLVFFFSYKKKISFSRMKPPQKGFFIFLNYTPRNNKVVVDFAYMN